MEEDGEAMMRNISQAAVDTWGLEAQMLMVAEEALELGHAVLKWRRAWKRYSRTGASLTRDDIGEDEILAEKAHARTLAKAVKHVQVEAMQVTFMIDQLKLMQPGDYQQILEDELKDTMNLLRQREVEI